MAVVFRIWTAAALALALVACGPRAGEGAAHAPDSVASAESTFAQEQARKFGVSYTLPDGWSESTQDQLDATLSAGADVMAGDNGALRREMDAALKESGVIFQVSRHPAAESVGFNHNIIGVTENLSGVPGPMTGADYLSEIRRTADLMAQAVVYSDTIGNRMIDGQTFAVLEGTTRYGDTDIQIKTSAARHGDIMIVFAQAFQGEAQRAESDAFMESIQLDW